MLPCAFVFFFPVVLPQEMEPDLNAALLENYKVMVGLYARLGVAPGALHQQQQCVVPDTCRRKVRMSTRPVLRMNALFLIGWNKIGGGRGGGVVLYAWYTGTDARRKKNCALHRHLCLWEQNLNLPEFRFFTIRLSGGKGSGEGGGRG